MELTKKQAKELSLQAWKIRIEKGENEHYDFPEEIIGLTNRFGYCEKYYYTSNSALLCCAKCPIRPAIKDYDSTGSAGCAQDCHPFHKWWLNSTSKNAQIVYDLILKS